MKRINRISLRLFDGGAAGGTGTGTAGNAGASASGGATGAMTAATAADNQAGASVTGGTDENDNNTGKQEQPMSPEERRAAYDRFKNEYKDLFGEDVQKQINRRYSQNQQLQQKLDSYAPLMDMLSAKYGVAADDVAAVMDALDKDTSFFEEQAMKEGMPVEKYKEFMRLQTKNRQMEAAQERSRNLRQQEQQYARWDAETVECKKLFPDFDFVSEVENNPHFLKLLGAGIDVISAYKAANFDKITQDMMAQTEKNTKKIVADNIRAGASRPVEAAASGGQVGKTSEDIMNMSTAEFLKFKEDVRAGRATL